jgi:hypothetical protein
METSHAKRDIQLLREASVHVDVYFVEAVCTITVAIVTAYQFYTSRSRKGIENIVSATFHKLMEEVIDPLKERVTIVETKMEVFWREIAGDMAKVLHHPEPSRARVDDLLDILMEAVLTPGEARELSGYLEIIRDWEPGQAAPFKIFPGEQVAAAILLHTMKQLEVGDDGEQGTNGSRGRSSGGSSDSSRSSGEQASVGC